MMHRTLRVGNYRTFKTVKAAMKSAKWGDTVVLDCGTYDLPITGKPGVTLTGGPIIVREPNPEVEAAVGSN